MPRTWFSVTALCALLFFAVPAAAESVTLLAASDPSQVDALVLAKVVAPDGSAWLSVRLKGRTQLAVVTSQAARTEAPKASDWLRALDFGTRLRVAAPPGPLPSCGGTGAFPLADSGLPEPALLAVSQTISVGSEIELRRALSDAGISVAVDAIARFESAATTPFEISFYQATSSGGSSAALRLSESGPGGVLPRVIVAGRGSLPTTVIALADRVVLPVDDDVALPSDFAVSYRASNQDTDYGETRWQWLHDSPTRWLIEAQGTRGLFDWTTFPGGETLAPALARYFGGACQAKVEAARARASKEPTDYVCDGADDLALSLTQLGFREPSLSRLFGTLPGANTGATVRGDSRAPRNPWLEATDFDTSGCPATEPVPGGMSTPPPVFTPAEPAPSGGESGPYYDPGSGEPVYVSGDTNCNVVFVSDDSCSGDTSSPPPSSSDSCSGDTTTDDSSDSCSGDSSSDDSSDSCSGDSSSDDSSDSCSGDSGSSSDDSSGCGKSEYDGDTCSGDTKGEAHAALGPSKPRRVRLSLLTLLLAAFALPLRRRTGFR